VTGSGNAGIYALNGTYTANSGTDLTISTADVSGGTDGIVALNYGSGALSVTANGTVTGGSGSGIRARNDGSDALTITATGTVTGTGAYGIEAVTHGTGLTIDAVAVSGASGGITAQKVGSGVLKITTTGMVEGGSGTGIAASTNSPTNSVVIEATDVSGGTGIDVYAWSGGAVSITATGTVTGTDGNGIWASGGTDVTVRANTVHGSENGISAINNGGLGPLTISATGTVTGGADGILARSFGTGLTISTAAVHGGHHGIEARNYIGDPLAITASGTVTGGAGYDGIFEYNDSGTDLTIDVAGVGGGDSGIHASNRYGSGVLRITASGTVTGTGNDGIYARSDGTDLTIDVADVSGGKNGINAHGNGTGALSIVAGAVTGGSGGGIYALNNRGTDLTISAVDVSGGTFGVNAVNDGSGALSITASGTVEGTSINGIIARNTGADLTIAAAAVSGERYGIGANNAGSGALSITATGAVTGANQDGIIAINFGSALTIAAAAVSGGNNGILARNFGSGALSITATGMVTGTGGDGIYVSNFDSGTTDLTIDMADVSGGKNGINAVNYGSGVLAITTSGTVTGGSGSGIAAVNNSASADSTTTVTVEDSSAVSGGAVGVGLLSTTGRAASLANAGSITGATGVVVSGGPATLSNTGAITGIGGPAIDLTGAGGVSTVNQKGSTITGAILLSAAADTINITGGAIAGSIVGQGSAVTNFALGSGSFSFAAPYAITGMAAVAMNSGTVAIAGTIDTDVLAVNGGTMTVAGAVNTPAFELNGGTLSVSSDANLGSGAGTLTFDGGTFESTAAFATARAVTLNAGGGTFRTDADLTVASGTTGSGGLTKTGTAALTLNGVNSFTGLTTINEGKLVVGDDAHARASLAGAVMVNSGGTLGGMGTVGSTTVASGGTIAPGNSIGTLTVKGDISFAAGSTYVAEINPALDSDLIAASGKATIDGGTVYAAKVAGVYTPGSRWTILGADGGVAGTFDALDQNMPFVALALAYDADHVYIDATRNSTAFCMAGMTFNQCSTGNGLESTGVGNPVYDAVAALPDEGAARRALDGLSGEIYASAKSALIEDSHFVRDAVNDRIRSAFGDATMGDMPVLAYGPEGAMPASPGEGLGVAGWGRAFGSWGSFDGDGNAAAMDTSTGGFIAGIDGAITSDIRLGFLAGYSHSSFDVGGRSSSGSSDNYHLGLYAGGKWNALRLTGGLAYTWHDIGTNRSVVFPGFRDSLTGDYHAGTFQVFGEAGYRINMGTVAFEPFANLAYVNLHTDGFTEDGGAAALHVRGDTTETTFTTLGIHLSSAFMVGGMRATAHGTLGWRHAFGDIAPLSTHAFAGGDPFAIAGVPIAKDAAVIDAGLDLDLTKAATFGVAYQGQFGSGPIQNGFKADLTVRF
jgi:outer membrane autotransporter protein